MGGMETTRGAWWHGDQQVGRSEGRAEGTATNNHTEQPHSCGANASACSPSRGQQVMRTGISITQGTTQ